VKQVVTDIKERFLSEQFVRFGIVGVLTNTVAYLAFLLIAYFGVEPKLAMTIVYLCSAFLGFIGHKKWSFSHEGLLLKTGMRFIVAHSLAYLLNLFLLYFFFNVLGYPYQLVQAGIIVVLAFFLYTMFKFFVFRSPG
jgi:putative flippase GtrA